MFHVKPFCMVSEKVKYQSAIIGGSEVQEQVKSTPAKPQAYLTELQAIFSGTIRPEQHALSARIPTHAIAQLRTPGRVGGWRCSCGYFCPRHSQTLVNRFFPGLRRNWKAIPTRGSIPNMRVLIRKPSLRYILFCRKDYSVYELNRVELLCDTCKRSCQQYVAVRQQLIPPDAVRLRYRTQLSTLIATIVRSGAKADLRKC